jgi:hypothetical protein
MVQYGKWVEKDNLEQDQIPRPIDHGSSHFPILLCRTVEVQFFIHFIIIDTPRPIIAAGVREKRNRKGNERRQLCGNPADPCVGRHRLGVPFCSAVKPSIAPPPPPPSLLCCCCSACGGGCLSLGQAQCPTHHKNVLSDGVWTELNVPYYPSILS